MHSIILIGGKGERLRPYTNDRPKGMIEINGKPLIEYQIEWLKSFGVTDFTFACGYLHEKIKEHFGDGKKISVNISYSIEDEPLGRGGALKKAWGSIKSNETIIVTNGDIYSEIDLDNAIKLHKSKNVKATICLFPFKSPYGIVNFDGDSIIQSFEEKPTLPYWINGGIYILEPEIKNMLPEKGDHETTLFPELAKSKQMYAYKSSKYWIGVDTAKDLNEFEKYLNKQ